MHDFAARLIAWQKAHGRHGLPWQVEDPYAVWVSEIMLQQTQVETVIPYYNRFMARFPDIVSLAAAAEDEVLALWSGLGYYARGRNLHAAARRLAAEHDSCFPRDFEAIQALPGIGRSTAAAISAFAFGERRAILDGNVKRVFCRLFGIEGWAGEKTVENRLWQLAEELLPTQDIQAYTQGVMDLGATLCRRSNPDCAACPFVDDCIAQSEGRVTELPSPRPRKDLPDKATAMLVLLHAGEILLEKRPPNGIWGGLWSLPECPLEADPVRAAHELGYAASDLGDLPELGHTFSHFRLRILPRRLAVAQRPTATAEAGRVWLPLADAEQAALPTPIRKIIAALN
ncbi:MAG TPA: A/G-specific adenine glycosylase [Parasulfuritortus sp.]